MEESLELLAVADVWDNGKAVREGLNADISLVIDHFRYFPGAIKAQEGGISQIDKETVAYHFHEPIGCCWTDYSLELPNHDGNMESSTSFSCKELCYFKTSRADASIN